MGIRRALQRAAAAAGLAAGLAAVVTLAVAVVAPRPAGAATLSVPSDANIYGAGHAVPPEPAGLGGGSLPPVFRFTPGPGQTLTFNGVTGCVAMTVSMGGCNDGDGSTLHVMPTGVTSYGGLSGISHDTNGFLIGVFLDDAEPVDPAPPSLDFRSAALGTSFATLSPVIGQTFFAGDGLTGTGAGAVQAFAVPPTATRLFLGFADGYGYSGPPGAYSDNSGSLDASFEIAGSCAVVVTSLPVGATICVGDTVTLDSSGMDLTGCPGSVLRDWSDGSGSVGSGVTLDASPGSTTSYIVTLTCDADPACTTAAAVDVVVEQPPDFVGAAVRDLRSCNPGLELTWPPAIFHDVTASGTYTVYRSEISCADALARPPIAVCITATRWLDTATLDGVTYFYAIVAESLSPTTCADRGPCNAGAATTACLPPITESAAAFTPVSSCAVLRAENAADPDDVTLSWIALRPLRADEHVHLLHASGSPTSGWALVNGEGDRGLSFVHVDTTSPLQFFDVRYANSCEIDSLDDEPPGHDPPAGIPCP